MCIGEDDVDVFDSLDGKLLVSYQVALKRADWERLSDAVVDSFRAQRTAYRRLHGGTHAPQLSVQEPKFQEQHENLKRSTMPMKIPIRGTFVHFSAGHNVFSDLRAADDLCALQRRVAA